MPCSTCANVLHLQAVDDKTNHMLYCLTPYTVNEYHYCPCTLYKLSIPTMNSPCSHAVSIGHPCTNCSTPPIHPCTHTHTPFAQHHPYTPGTTPIHPHTPLTHHLLYHVSIQQCPYNSVRMSPYNSVHTTVSMCLHTTVSIQQCPYVSIQQCPYNSVHTSAYKVHTSPYNSVHTTVCICLDSTVSIQQCPCNSVHTTTHNACAQTPFPPSHRPILAITGSLLCES
jgi:hypothetical protein